MITAKNSMIKIQGDPAEIMTEASYILKVVYENMVEEFGKELADILLTDIGKFAVVDDEDIEDMTKDLMKEIDEVLKK